MVLQEQHLKIHKILHMLTGAPGGTTTKPNGQPPEADGFRRLVCEGLMNCQRINESRRLSDLTVFLFCYGWLLSAAQHGSPVGL